MYRRTKCVNWLTFEIAQKKGLSITTLRERESSEGKLKIVQLFVLNSSREG